MERWWRRQGSGSKQAMPICRLLLSSTMLYAPPAHLYAGASELLERHPDTQRFLGALETLQAPPRAAEAADWQAARGLFHLEVWVLRE